MGGGSDDNSDSYSTDYSSKEIARRRREDRPEQDEDEDEEATTIQARVDQYADAFTDNTEGGEEQPVGADDPNEAVPELAGGTGPGAMGGSGGHQGASGGVAGSQSIGGSGESGQGVDAASRTDRDTASTTGQNTESDFVSERLSANFSDPLPPSSTESGTTRQFEDYREEVKEELEDAGIKPGSNPAGDAGAYLNTHREDPSQQFSNREPRSGSMPEAVLDLDNKQFRGGGFRSVEEGDLPGDGDHVFLATYDERGKELFFQERATYAFLDAVGARVPRHEFDEEPPDSDARSISREASGTPIEDITEPLQPNGEGGGPLDDYSKELLDSVDEKQAINHMSVQIINGNWDLSPDNLLVTNGNGDNNSERSSISDDGEIGNLVCHDLDRGADGFTHDSKAARAVSKATKTLKRMDIDISKADLWRNSRQIAQDIVRSENLDDVTDPVAETDPRRAEAIAHNIGYVAADPDGLGEETF